jgi:hypothetical protein
MAGAFLLAPAQSAWGPSLWDPMRQSSPALVIVKTWDHQRSPLKLKVAKETGDAAGNSPGPVKTGPRSAGEGRDLPSGRVAA